MADTYVLNPNPTRIDTSRKPIGGGADKPTNMAIVVIGAVIVVGLIYWWSVSRQAVAPTAADQQAALRSQVAALLNQSPAKATPEQINSVATQLRSAPSAATQADKQRVAAMLQNQ